jgi:predicted O-methyltransferase YrrM
MNLKHRLDRLNLALKLRQRGIAAHMRIFSHTSAKERIALFDIARALPAGAQALEIGSHIGSSALFLGAGLKTVGGRLFCVDTWNNETMPDGEQDTYPTFAANTAEFAGLITPLRKRSDFLTFEEIGTKLDFAFIDGDHSEDSVRKDFTLLEPWMKPVSIIAFHDASVHFPGVNKVIGEVLAGGRWQLAGFVDDLCWVKRVGG